MNINETRHALSYLYSTHPHAPTLNPGDKTRMVYAFFRVLYKYSLNDVIDGIDRACEKSTQFIPSAYEIERNVEKSIDITQFLPEEYNEIIEKLGNYRYENLYDRLYKVVRKARAVDDETEKKRLEYEAEKIQSFIDLNERANSMMIAESKALTDYDNMQTTIAAGDLIQLQKTQE